MIQRGIPTPPALDRHEAEREQFIDCHLSSFVGEWYESGDLTMHPLWDEAGVRQHWPELWELWRRFEQAKAALTRHFDNEMKRRGA